MADYIVAIDLGTSHLTGIVGEKHADGTFSIVAYETVDTDSCIRRGLIYNRDNTATHVGNLLRKLENRLKGGYIDKVYVGVGGQSLRSIEKIEKCEIADGAAVTEEDIAFLKEQCERYKPDLLDVLAIAPAVYYINGQRDAKPVGAPCKQFEAHYKLVIGRTSIRQDITKSIEDQLGKKVEILVSPLTLADAMLSPEEKELGCALVDFGAGVTSVTIFKDGSLKHVSVIPFGGKLITRDIAITLPLTEMDAEKLKKENGSAIIRKEDENEVLPIEMEGSDYKIKLKDMNAIIEGRVREIVDNVYARISEAIEFRQLGAGIVLAGCASELNGLQEFIKDKCKLNNVRYSAIRKELVKGSTDILGNPSLMTAISLMLKGIESCVSNPVAIGLDIKQEQNDNQEMEPEDIAKINANQPDRKNVPDVKKEEVKNKKNIKKQISDFFVTKLFDD